MLKLGSAFFLLLVQTTPLILCQTGPYHASADNFARAYAVDNAGFPRELGPKMDSVSFGYNLDTAPEGTVYIAIAAANQVPPPGWTSYNPAWILFSSDKDAAGPRIVSDTTWKCQTYPVYKDGGFIEQRMWPNSADARTAIVNLVGTFETLLDATEVLGNWPNFVPRIALGAKRIWYAGLSEEGSEAGIKPTNNVICLKKL